MTKRGFEKFSDYCAPRVPTVANKALSASVNNQSTTTHLAKVTFRTRSIQTHAHAQTHTHTHTQTDPIDLALF